MKIIWMICFSLSLFSVDGYANFSEGVQDVADGAKQALRGGDKIKESVKNIYDVGHCKANAVFAGKGWNTGMMREHFEARRNFHIEELQKGRDKAHNEYWRDFHAWCYKHIH